MKLTDLITHQAPLIKVYATQLRTGTNIAERLFLRYENQLTELISLEHSILKEYYAELNELIAQYGFHLLDIEPFIYEGVGFVGNVGWYDFSLYEGNKIVWGLCGHTHRSGRIEKNGFHIDNVSSDENQAYLEIEL